MTDWVNLDSGKSVNQNDKPRLLTEEEIEYIIKHIPKAPAADPYAAKVAREEVVKWMKQTLRQELMCPSAIPELISNILEQHTKSLVVPGTPVGITAGEAVGASTTQMTLNTFHLSGQSKSATFGIDAMRDIIFARKNPKNEGSTIYFLNKSMSYEEVLDARAYIVGSVVKDFVLDYDILDRATMTNYWWYDAAVALGVRIPAATKVMRLKLNTIEMYKHKVSISELAKVMTREIPCNAVPVHGPISDAILDLYPEPSTITQCLTERLKSLGSKPIPPELTEITYLENIVWPSLATIRVKGIAGIRDLFPMPSPVLRMVLSERKMTINDIEYNDVAALTDPARVWFLFYNPVTMMMTGLKPENLAALCWAAGLDGLAGDDTKLMLTMPDDSFRTDSGETVLEREKIKYRQIPLSAIKKHNNKLYVEYDKKDGEIVPANILKLDIKRTLRVGNRTIPKTIAKYYREIVQPQQSSTFILEPLTTAESAKVKAIPPTEYINGKIAADNIKREAIVKTASDVAMVAAKILEKDGKVEEAKDLLRKATIVERTPLMKAAEFMTAETEGSNLKEMLALEGIDKERTTCNNMYVIAETLGIEAARSFVIRALSNTIANNGAYVNPANIAFIAEFITSRGEPFGATFTGISRQPGGHLSLSTLERAGKVLTKSALHGRSEDIRNVSASVMMGERMAMGDGAFDIAQDISENGTKITLVNNDLFTGFVRDDNTKILQQNVGAEEGGEDMLEQMNKLLLDVGRDIEEHARSDEKDSNVKNLFGVGTDIMPDVAREGVNRLKLKHVNPSDNSGRASTLPEELVDTRDFIKVGVPRDDRIKAAVPIVLAVPIISTGLVVRNIPGIPLSGTLSKELDDLLKAFGDFSEEENYREPPAALRKVINMPEVEIPRLQTASARARKAALAPVDLDSLIEAVDNF